MSLWPPNTKGGPDPQSVIICESLTPTTTNPRVKASAEEGVLPVPHISKWPRDLKINGTQENVTFSSLVFHSLSCGVFLFVASVSFKNNSLNGWNFSTANQALLFYGF